MRILKSSRSIFFCSPAVMDTDPMQGQMLHVLGVVPQASDSVEAFLHLKQQVLFRIIIIIFFIIE